MGSSYGNAAILDSVDSVQLLERVPLLEPPFDEKQLQNILEKHPHLLPIQEIESIFDPPLCIGREVVLASGKRIDLLCVSPSGYLTIVETKLWKNSEARREVVAQVFEYASQLNAWGYEQLEAKTREYRHTKSESKGSLFDFVAEQYENVDEREFIDGVSRCLSSARFLLAIVGEGIREGVEDMVDFIHTRPQLFFNMALIELACFRSEPKKTFPLVMLPRIVMKTKEVERAVVKVTVDARAAADAEVNVEVPKPSKTATGPTVQLSEDQYFAALTDSIGAKDASIIREWANSLSQNPALEVNVGSRDLTLRLVGPEGAKPADTTLLFVLPSGRMQAATWLYVHFGKWGLPREPVESFWNALGKIHADLKPVVSAKRTSGFISTRVPIAGFLDRLPAIGEHISALIDAVGQGELPPDAS